jgi:hypothetical protein
MECRLTEAGSNRLLAIAFACWRGVAALEKPVKTCYGYTIALSARVEP